MFIFHAIKRFLTSKQPLFIQYLNITLLCAIIVYAYKYYDLQNQPVIVPTQTKNEILDAFCPALQPVKETCTGCNPQIIQDAYNQGYNEAIAKFEKREPTKRSSLLTHVVETTSRVKSSIFRKPRTLIAYMPLYYGRKFHHGLYINRDLFNIGGIGISIGFGMALFNYDIAPSMPMYPTLRLNTSGVMWVGTIGVSF